LVNVSLGLFLYLLLYIFLIILSEFIKSLDWILIGFSKGISKPFRSIEEALKTYPGKFFEDFKFRFILFFSPLYFVATLVVPVFRGINVVNFWFQIFGILVFSFIFGFLTFFSWRYGLKNYEAFG